MVCGNCGASHVTVSAVPINTDLDTIMGVTVKWEADPDDRISTNCILKADSIILILVKLNYNVV